MRYVNVLVASAAVVVGFAGSLTAAQALSLPSDPSPLAQVLPALPLPLTGQGDNSLTVTFKADDKSKPVVMTLSCHPTGGDHPRAEEACARLDAVEQDGTDPFAKPAPDEVCTYIYGGPQTAAVVGTWKGEAVDAKFSRANGCEIARWNAIEPVLSPTKTSARTAMRTDQPAAVK
jgi:hypothetical protein